MKNDAPVIWLLRNLLNPLLIVATLSLTMFVFGAHYNSHYMLLAGVSLFISSRIFSKLDLLETWQHVGFSAYSRELLMGWITTIGILLFLGFALKLTEHYSRLVLLSWFAAVPIVLLTFQWRVRHLLLALRSKNKLHSAIIVGANDLGLQLANKISNDPYLFMSVHGFIDDRNGDRLTEDENIPILGGLRELPQYVKQHRIKTIYIALPMTMQPRIMRLLDALRDTTASIYFVPDMFVFDLAQARFGEVSGIPVIAVSETPFTGLNAVIKRSTDFTLSILLLILFSPLMLAIAIGVKFSSPGPVLFRQRRYGLDGEEIIVRKYRTMTVLENGDQVKQATRDDNRITRFGGFLRRTSLDELPQLFNVVLGNMSLVGPRPHAVAHNEMYRNLIKGYMIRHKVKPGITGLAQINGLRGETEILDKMRKRVNYDLNYMRNWSLGLDLWVILHTAILIFRDDNAY